jgi:hypothetical protein
MNTRRTAQADAIPPAATGGAQPGTSRLMVQQVHVVAGRETSAAPGKLGASIEAPDVARLDQEIGELAAQNERLLKSVDTLLHLHESEKAQRQSLQAMLDRVLEEGRISASAPSLETLGTELRNGVSQDLKPLLHAIIELLELAARRRPAPPATTPESDETEDAADSRDRVAEQDDDSKQLPSEDLPGALPEILTKSVEELVGMRRADCLRTHKSKKSNADGNHRRNAINGHRPHAWIPVTSGTFKP